jgi:regulator of replication initiation timing
MSGLGYSDEYMQSVWNRIDKLHKENDTLRVAMRSMASAATVKDLNNTIDILARCTKVDAKAKTDLLAQIHRLEDKLVSTGLSDAALQHDLEDKLEDEKEAGVQLQIEVSDLKERLHNNFQSTTINRLESALRGTTEGLRDSNNARDEYCEYNRNLSQELDVVVEALRACRVDKEHMQNTIRDLDKAAAEPWVYTTKVRKLNADLEDKVKDLETTMFVHSCKSDDVATLEKDRAALDTLNRMLLKNNKALRARLNNLEGPGYADAIKQIVSGVKYFADNYKGE